MGFRNLQEKLENTSSEIKPHFYAAEFSKKKIPKPSIRKQFEEFLPTSNQQHRQFATDLDFPNPSNTRYVYGVAECYKNTMGTSINDVRYQGRY